MTMQSREISLSPAPSPRRGIFEALDIKRLCLGIAALACLANAQPEPEPEPEPVPEQAPEQANAPEDFVGLYDGSSFETYMGLQLLADGTFGWELSVGGLDLRSRGVWTERDGAIHFTTLPTPVPPEFRFLRLEAEEAPSAQFVPVHVIGPRGKPFTNAETEIECANGNQLVDFVAGSNAYFDGYTPDECDRPVAVTVVQSNFNVTSPRYDLAAMGWQPGQGLHVEFVPNDIGVLDLTGMRGILVDGVLSLEGPLGTERFRKVSGAQELPE